MNASDGHSHDSPLDLSLEDQQLLDALIDSEFDRAAMPAALGRALTDDDQRRLDTLTRLLELMGDYPVEDAEPSLLHATLARIDRHEEQHAQRLRFDIAQEQHASRRTLRIRIPDLITVAAVMLIAVGVLWPVAGAIRRQSIDNACANNLKTMGYAFSQYANDNNGSLPYAMAGPMGTWENFRNALNLNPLVKGGYCDEGHLECPGHHQHSDDGAGEGGPSYSYRWLTPVGLVHWNTGRVTVILGDLNPLIDAGRSGLVAPPLSVSINHGGRGQNVLTSDGRTIWLAQPIIGGTGGRGDNIWMPDNIDALRRGATPADDADTFLVH